MPLLNPLTQEHVDAVERVLRSMADIKDTIAACESCGLDMEQRKEWQQAQETFAAAVKRIFMPHLP